jgi:hypothetical protein
MKGFISPLADSPYAVGSISRDSQVNHHDALVGSDYAATAGNGPDGRDTYYVRRALLIPHKEFRSFFTPQVKIAIFVVLSQSSLLSLLVL